MFVTLKKRQFETVPRAALVGQLVDARAAKALAARDAVVVALRPLKTLKVADERFGVEFRTQDAKVSRLTVTMSVREAMALTRVMGPVGELNSDGPTARLLCAMGLVNRQVVHSKDRTGVGMRAVLMVLRVCVDDCIARCVDLPRFEARVVRKKPPRV